jgi:hypothetical protein
LERRGYFFVDKLAYGDRKLTLNFIPDGKAKRMSPIEHKFDAKKLQTGESADAAEKAPLTGKQK